MNNKFPETVKIVDVGPRDGLQNEKTRIELSTKVELVNRLAAAGCRHIEAGAFVSPKWVPQMADSDELFKSILRVEGVTYSALVPNLRGFEAAMAANVDEIAVFAAASETFSQKNINCSVAESIERFNPVVEAAGQHKIPVRGYISTAIDCPYEGRISPTAVAKVTKALIDLGCYEISLGDTIGTATPVDCQQMLEAVLTVAPVESLAVHFHNTYGMAIANVFASLQLGIKVVDASIGGLGGCPYAPGASGNVSTEDVVYLLSGLGIEHGLSLDKIRETGKWIRGVIRG
jgi:hydroxymethylglutaryl-CoA lyase